MEVRVTPDILLTRIVLIMRSIKIITIKAYKDVKKCDILIGAKRGMI